MSMKKNVYFVSGIDTNIGKSYATAYLAKTWNERGIRTITEKTDSDGEYGHVGRHRTAPPDYGYRLVAGR